MKTKLDPKTAKEIIKLVECLKFSKEELKETKYACCYYNYALDDVIKVVRESTNG